MHAHAQQRSAVPGGSQRVRGCPPLGRAGRDADEHAPLLGRVHAVVDDLRVVQVAGPVKDLLRVGGALRSRKARLNPRNWITRLPFKLQCACMHALAAES